MTVEVVGELSLALENAFPVLVAAVVAAATAETRHPVGYFVAFLLAKC